MTWFGGYLPYGVRMPPASPSHQGWSLRERRVWFPLLCLVLLAAALRFLPLTHEALSGDELFSRHVVMQSPARGWQEVQQDLVHPPLYYMILKLSTGLWGASALGLRMLSLISGLLALPVLVITGSRLPGARWTGLLAAACVAVGRSHVFYSEEARSYTLYTLVVLLLALWMSYLDDPSPRQARFWIVGFGLMTALLYIHYVGGVFVALALISVLLSGVSRPLKLRVTGCALAAFVCFAPWLLGEVEVYRNKRGLGGNLDWQGHPSFYDLRQVWATALGVNTFSGATLLALLLALVLCGAAFFLVARKGLLRQTPLLIGLVCMGWLPPLIIFALSRAPVNLPLFGLRHLLPATVLLTLLSAYGLELLVQQLRTPQTAFAITACCGLVLLSAVPTFQEMRTGPFRYPYDRMKEALQVRQQKNIPAYAVWYYGVAEPVNFYCQRQCVQPLPASGAVLPPKLLLLYRPAAIDERAVYERLLHQGYIEKEHTYFTDGRKTSYGTMLATLVRVSH